MKKILISIIALALPLSCFSMKPENGQNGNNMNKPKMTKEQMIQKHENMKGLHDKAIQCLKSDKDPQECRKQFKGKMKEMRGNKKMRNKQNGFDQMAPASDDGYVPMDTNVM